MAQGDVLRHRQTHARLRLHSSKGGVDEAGLTSTTVTQHQDTRTVLDQILHALLGWAKMIWNTWNGYLNARKDGPEAKLRHQSPSTFMSTAFIGRLVNHWCLSQSLYSPRFIVKRCHHAIVYTASRHTKKSVTELSESLFKSSFAQCALETVPCRFPMITFHDATKLLWVGQWYTSPGQAVVAIVRNAMLQIQTWRWLENGKISHRINVMHNR